MAGPNGPGGGPWRAFLHVMSSGRKLTRATLMELSGMYHGLSKEDKAFYTEMGQAATDSRRRGGPSLPKKAILKGPKWDRAFAEAGVPAQCRQVKPWLLLKQ